MDRRTLLKLFPALGALSLGGKAAVALSLSELSEDEVKALVARALVVDALSLGHEWDEVEFDALKRSNYSGFHATLLDRTTLEGAVRELAEWNKRIDELPDTFRAALKGEDFIKAKEAGQVAVLLGFQDTLMIGHDLDNLNVLHNMGCRCLQLTYNFRNYVGNGCLERVDGGLSDFGVEVVRRMNELGILVDLSHCGYQTSLDGVAFSEKPVAYTHTMCEAIYRDHPRAKTDEQIKALADAGGYIGITMIGYFVGPDPGGETDIEDYANHIDHAVNIAGIDHVGLSSDYAIRGISPWATKESWYEPRLKVFKPSYQVRWPPWIPELDVPERMLNIANALNRRGYSEDKIEKLLGLNWVRLFKKVL